MTNYPRRMGALELALAVQSYNFSFPQPVRIVLRKLLGGLLLAGALSLCSWPRIINAATQVVAWGGYNLSGSVILTNLTNVVEISSEGDLRQSLGLKNNGSIVEDSYTPFYGGYDYIYIPPGLSNAIAIAGSPTHADGGGYELALKSDGTIVLIGYCCTPTEPPPDGLSNVVAIASGAWHGLALKSDGTVVSFGFLATNVPAGLSNVVAISAGFGYSLALKANGTVTAWKTTLSYGDYGETNIPVGLNNVVAISAGRTFAIALKSDGKVVAWGSDQNYGYGFSQTNVPVGLSNVVAISAGTSYSLALKNNGTVTSWGNYYYTNVPTGLSNVVATSAGDYSLALVGNGPPRSPAAPLNLTLAYGTPLVLPATTSGTIGFSYKWNFNSTNLPGATNMAFILNSLAFTNSGTYDVAVSNSFGVVTNSYNISIVPLLITIPPQNQTVYGGSTAAFSVTTSGVNLNYQWRFNGTNLDGATNATLTLANVLPEQAGAYAIVVSNPVGALTNSVILSVTPLAITSQPQDQSAFLGGSAAFSIGTAGNLPLNYRWQFNSNNLTGATDSTFTLTNVQFANTGNYRVIVTNAYNSVTSASVALTVLPFLFNTDPANIQMTSNGFQIQVNGSAGILPVIIDASSNLVNWQPIFTNPPAVGSMQFLDAAATNSPQMFYRARQQ